MTHFRLHGQVRVCADRVVTVHTDGTTWPRARAAKRLEQVPHASVRDISSLQQFRENVNILLSLKPFPQCRLADSVGSEEDAATVVLLELWIQSAYVEVELDAQLLQWEGQLLDESICRSR